MQSVMEKAPLPALVREWSASGSGCRGGASNAPGSSPVPAAPNDVRLEVIAPRRESPRTHVFRFQLGGYGLKLPSAGVLPAPLTVARECAIRIALYPRADERVSVAIARSSYRVSKPAGAAMWTQQDLSLGNTTVARSRTDFPAGEKLSNREGEVSLIPGRSAEESMPETRCGQPKLLSHDIIFVADRRSAADEYQAVLTEGGKVEITVETARCT